MTHRHHREADRSPQPLAIGYAGPVRRFNVRDEAVTWVKSALVPGDGVLYLNDLPDHYP